MEYICLYCYDLLITRPCLYILGSTMQVDKSKRLQERERGCNIQERGSLPGTIYTEIRPADLPQVSTNLFCFFEMFTYLLWDLAHYK
jgi:hypothetical protein